MIKVTKSGKAYLASQFKYGEGLVIKLVYDAMVTDNIEAGLVL